MTLSFKKVFMGITTVKNWSLYLEITKKNINLAHLLPHRARRDQLHHFYIIFRILGFIGLLGWSTSQFFKASSV